jgi:hypothetical protein
MKYTESPPAPTSRSGPEGIFWGPLRASLPAKYLCVLSSLDQGGQGGVYTALHPSEIRYSQPYLSKVMGWCQI